MTSLTPEKLKNLFEDLGKPTMRGVRKCPKCGTFNGTRGISCKNKNCDVVFKEKEKKRGHSADAVKIITGSTVQVFSVRLRDRGPDYRGFVQLPLVQDMDGNPAESVDPSLLAQAARCYVETCTCNTHFDIQQEPCNHVKAAIGCETEAQPLTLKNSVLNSLQVSNETKQAIWLLATETTGPLVQRVTKNIMVVKCKPSAKQPLGFLHFAFFETSRNRAAPEHKFQCSCRNFKSFKASSSKEESLKRCVHFYACICAFASDEKLTDEFAHYINLSDSSGEVMLPQDHQLVTILNTEGQAMASGLEATSIEVVLDEDGLLTTTDPNNKRTLKAEEVAEAGIEIVYGSEVVEDLLAATTSQSAPAPTSTTTITTSLPEAKRPRKDDPVVQASSALLTLQESANAALSTGPTKKPIPQRLPAQAKTATVTPKKQTTPVDELDVNISFHQWLASVTERINQTMHYQFDGYPDPLVFHAPQVFFDCLQHRISTGNKKKRLPNFTTGFVRRDALPLGTFTKYTWHITNILHVKQIFDTPEMVLDITRSFVENRDNTYDLYEHPKLQVENLNDNFNKNQTPIRPFELKTYLKVGNTSADQKEPTPFIIEWIPDILPKTHIGELRIKFEYGHQRNGQIEHRIQQAPVPMHANIIQIA